MTLGRVPLGRAVIWLCRLFNKMAIHRPVLHYSSFFDNYSSSTMLVFRRSLYGNEYIIKKMRCKNISMLHLSTGIAVQNKIHPATEWGSHSKCSEMQWNGEANEEIPDRHGINLRVRQRCCRGRFAGPSAAAADPGRRQGADRQSSNRQSPDWQGPDRQGAGGRSRTDRHQGLIRQTDGSTPSPSLPSPAPSLTPPRQAGEGRVGKRAGKGREGAKREVELLRDVAITGARDRLRPSFT
jgi:hypothetical protein